MALPRVRAAHKSEVVSHGLEVVAVQVLLRCADIWGELMTEDPDTLVWDNHDPEDCYRTADCHACYLTHRFRKFMKGD